MPPKSRRRQSKQDPSENPSNDSGAQAQCGSPTAAGFGVAARATGSPQAKTKTSKTLSKSSLGVGQPLEAFLAAGLLRVPPPSSADEWHGFYVVQPTDLIGDVVEQMHRRRLRSCAVRCDSDRHQFFDCMDLCGYLIEVLEAVQGQDWESFRKVLRETAKMPLERAMQHSSVDFDRFDSNESLEKLLSMFRSRRRVPVYRDGSFCCVITTSDILELCSCSLVDGVKSALESTKLSDVLQECARGPNANPGLLSQKAVYEDLSLLDVLKSMHVAGLRVVPVCEVDVLPSSSSAAKTKAESISAYVGLFDIAAVRVLYGKRDATTNLWWWDDDSIATNIFQEPCMDFMSLGPPLFGASSSSKPFHTVLHEELCTKVVARALSCNYQSVVVQGLATPEGGDASSGRGLLSGWSLVVALFSAGCMKSLRFDPAKSRKDPALPNPVRPDRRPPTLQRSTIEAACTAVAVSEVGAATSPPHRTTGVMINDVVELDALRVPTCAEHGSHFMRYKRANERTELDFSALKEWAADARADGAQAFCSKCDKPMGKIVYEPRASTMFSPEPDKAGFLPSFLANSSLFDSLNINGSGGTTKEEVHSDAPSTVVKEPLRSALKTGTPGACACKAAPKRLTSKNKDVKASAPSPQAAALPEPMMPPAPQERDRCHGIFSFCLAPCASTNKAKIGLAVAVPVLPVPSSPLASPRSRNASKQGAPAGSSPKQGGVRRTAA